MPTSESSQKGTCSVRMLKPIFFVVIVLCFSSIMLMRVTDWGSATVRVDKTVNQLLSMTTSQQMKLVKEALSPPNTTKTPSSIQSTTTMKGNVTTTIATTILAPTVLVPREDIQPNLTKAYNFLYAGLAQDPGDDEVKKSCPAIPPTLVGPIKVLPEEYPMSELNSLGFRVSAGGSYSPPCTAAQKLAIVIPFRNREAHLAILLLNLHPFLQKQQLDYTIFVVNQIPGSKFNRAMLMNIGFVEALKRDKYTCVIFHDVDLLPENDKNLYTCAKDNPRHMSAYINKFDYKLPYVDILGGIVAIQSKHFVKVNGYSNQFFGWGGEDDDFARRCKNKALTVVRYPKELARYQMIKHTKDTGNEANPKRFEMLKHTSDRQVRDGLNTLTYDLKSVQQRPLYTRINIVIDQPTVMNALIHPLPDFLLDL